jgi:hypothetical protein
VQTSDGLTVFEQVVPACFRLNDAALANNSKHHANPRANTSQTKYLRKGCGRICGEKSHANPVINQDQ